MKFEQKDNYQFEIKTLEKINNWSDHFELLRNEILSSNDPKKNNYSKKNFDLAKQEDITLLFLNGKIACFSSIYRRDLFPKNSSRVLNRTWKAKHLRTIAKPYWLISRHMLLSQIKVAKELNKDFVFISVEGPRRKWIQRWVDEARLDNQNWRVLDGMCHVAPSDNSACWQHVAALPLKNNVNFDFNSISHTAWYKLRNFEKGKKN